MTLWLVRAGSRGENEDYALENDRIVIGWEDLGDLSGVDSRENIDELVREQYSDENSFKLSVWTGQVWKFRSLMQHGDLAVLPLKKRPQIAIGEIAGDYHFDPDAPADAKHHRPVRWLKSDIPRTAFDQDLLYSFGSLLTVSQPRAERSEERVRAMLTSTIKPVRGSRDTSLQMADEIAEEPIDLDALALDEIRKFIARRFKGHKFADLVAGVLEAQGYHTVTSPPGPDAGVDIVAGRGGMGFDPPRICVQVKSGEAPVDVTVLRELQGVMKSHGADHGLIVAWGGFKDSVRREGRRAYFELRLWDSDEFIEVIKDHYDQLPDSLQVELPLKRVWTLAREE